MPYAAPTSAQAPAPELAAILSADMSTQEKARAILDNAAATAQFQMLSGKTLSGNWAQRLTQISNMLSDANAVYDLNQAAVGGKIVAPSPRTRRNRIPDNDSITGHIFRKAEGHIPDTPENRALLEAVANDVANFRGVDKYGNEWHTKTQSDGSQVWVESRNGNIFEGGVNDTPKPWSPETGLKEP